MSAPASPVRAYKKALPKKRYNIVYTTKYVAEFKEDRTKFNQIVSLGIITSLFLGIGFVALFILSCRGYFGQGKMGDVRI